MSDVPNSVEVLQFPSRLYPTYRGKNEQLRFSLRRHTQSKMKVFIRLRRRQRLKVSLRSFRDWRNTTETVEISDRSMRNWWDRVWDSESPFKSLKKLKSFLCYFCDGSSSNEIWCRFLPYKCDHCFSTNPLDFPNSDTHGSWIKQEITRKPHFEENSHSYRMEVDMEIDEKWTETATVKNRGEKAIPCSSVTHVKSGSIFSVLVRTKIGGTYTSLNHTWANRALKVVRICEQFLMFLWLPN